MRNTGPGPINRRDLIKSAVMLAGGAGVSAGVSAQAAEWREVKRSEKCTPCLFTKPLHNRKVAELPAVLHALGINAVDLTCRPEGHVLPERVTEDLPKAVEILEAAGVSVTMVTTAITDADEGDAQAVIKTVGQLGIRHIKLGYYDYKDIRRIMPTITDAQKRIKDVVALCKEHGVHAGYHNHSGKRVGAGLWDAWHLLLGTSAIDAGVFYDLRHAMVEGGDAGWEIGLNLLAPRITMLAFKDFVWGKDENGRWRADDVPLGTGMVRLEPALRQMKDLGIAGPASLHVEYAARARAVDSEQDSKYLKDIRNDWQTLNAALQKARMV